MTFFSLTTIFWLVALYQNDTETTALLLNVNHTCDSLTSQCYSHLLVAEPKKIKLDRKPSYVSCTFWNGHFSDCIYLFQVNNSKSIQS